jgi:energy-coupling factor transporter ATP-binding protein EcfA2
MSSGNVIESRGLARTFRTRTGTAEAVCGVDFHVAGGEIVGFLGPNGAGKTTTQRMLATLLVPTVWPLLLASGCASSAARPAEPTPEEVAAGAAIKARLDAIPACTAEARALAKPAVLAGRSVAGAVFVRGHLEIQFADGCDPPGPGGWCTGPFVFVAAGSRGVGYVLVPMNASDLEWGAYRRMLDAPGFDGPLLDVVVHGTPDGDPVATSLSPAPLAVLRLERLCALR